MENKNHYISFGKLGQVHPTTVMACFSLFYVAAWSSVTLLIFGHILFQWDLTTELMYGQDLAASSPEPSSSFAKLAAQYIFSSRGNIRNGHHKPSFYGAVHVYGLFIRTALR